jgi:hypothetical protein
MKAKDLLNRWDKLDVNRLLPKPVSIRLPMSIMAKLAALEEMYGRTRTDIITDLLQAGLDDVEQNLPKKKGEGPGTRYSALLGETPYAEFVMRANQHYQTLERAMGNPEADNTLLYSDEELEKAFESAKGGDKD